MKIWNEESYNKTLQNGHGTLIGNWHEEKALQNTIGVTRARRGQHIPKSRDLLFSLPPDEIAQTVNVPKTVDSFSRVLPNQRIDVPQTTNHEYGKFEDRTKQFRKTGLRFEMIEKQVGYQGPFLTQ